LPFFKSLIVDLWIFQFWLLLQFFSSPLRSQSTCNFADITTRLFKKIQSLRGKVGRGKRSKKKRIHFRYEKILNCKRKINN
jgi:hypothetical protein